MKSKKTATRSKRKSAWGGTTVSKTGSMFSIFSAWWKLAANPMIGKDRRDGAPMGYKNIREGAESKHGRKVVKVVIDESTKKAVLRIIELCALKGFSFYAIPDEILIESILPENRARCFSKSMVEGVLKNPFFEGGQIP